MCLDAWPTLQIALLSLYHAYQHAQLQEDARVSQSHGLQAFVTWAAGSCHMDCRPLSHGLHALVTCVHAHCTQLQWSLLILTLCQG